MNSKYQIALLAVLSIWLFTVNLWGYDLWPPDEPRFAQVSREMMMSGNYLAPHINGEPYTEKPPLLFWLISAVSAPFGDVTEFTARVPSAVAGVATVLCTYALAQRMFGSAVALWSGLVLMTFQRFWWQARFAQIDMTLTACVTGALLFFWLWHGERRTRYLVGFYAAIAAGLLAKGPPAIVFPLLTAIFFYWGRRSDRRELHLVLGLTAAIAVVMLWLVPARMAVVTESAATEEIGGNLYRQIIGRFFLGVSHDRPFYYYLVNLPADLFPWTLCLPWTVVWVWKHRRDGDPMRFLLSWSLPAIVFFSLSAGKRALYLLPIHPALAILVACSLVPLLEGGFRRWRVSIEAAWAVALVIMAVAPYAILFTEHAESWRNSLVAITLVALLCGVQTVWDAARNEGRQVGRNLVVHFALLTTLLVSIGFPQINVHKSAKEFCEPLRKLAERDVGYRLYSLGFSREEYVFYAEHFHEYIPSVPIAFDATGQEVEEKLGPILRNSLQAPAVGASGNFTAQDVAVLQETLQAAYARSDLPESMVQAHYSAVAAALQEFFQWFEGPEPAFIITRERHWRWMLAYYPGANDATILRNTGVGNRHVVLLANKAARDVVAGHGLGQDAPERLSQAGAHRNDLPN